MIFFFVFKIVLCIKSTLCHLIAMCVMFCRHASSVVDDAPTRWLRQAPGAVDATRGVECAEERRGKTGSDWWRPKREFVDGVTKWRSEGEKRSAGLVQNSSSAARIWDVRHDVRDVLRAGRSKTRGTPVTCDCYVFVFLVISMTSLQKFLSLFLTGRKAEKADWTKGACTAPAEAIYANGGTPLPEAATSLAQDRARHAAVPRLRRVHHIRKMTS